jgi:DNA-directed RNA polymerase sigma subunit (sigma70/sigma32)
MARTAALPILTAEPGLTHYFEEIRRFPMLERQEEYMLAKRWRESTSRSRLARRLRQFPIAAAVNRSPAC